MYEEINPYMVTPSAAILETTQQGGEWTHNPTYGETLPRDMMGQEAEDGWTSNPTYNEATTWQVTMQSTPTTTPTNTTSAVNISASDEHDLPSPRNAIVSMNYYKQNL